MAAKTKKKNAPPKAKKKAVKANAAPRKKKAAAKTKKKANAPKKKPSVAPKISPLRGMSPDDWAKRLEGWHADALRIIRALVARHAPQATLAIKWGQPVWEHNGPFAWAKPSTKHFSFGFWRGADLDDPGGHLEGEGDRMRHVKITSAEQLSELPLEAYVKQAVELNSREGDPTKR